MEILKKFEKTLGEIMINMLSHFDLDKEMEKIYQVFMIGLVRIFDGGNMRLFQMMRADMEDMILSMIPIKSNEKAYLMEFKISKTENRMTLKAEEALKQIDEKKYDTRLKARGIKKILTKDSKKSPTSISGRWIAFFVKKIEKRILLWYNFCIKYRREIIKNNIQNQKEV